MDREERCNGQRIIEWLDNKNRKPANLAFTEGLERQIAYRVEMLLSDAVQPIPKEGVTESFTDLPSGKDVNPKDLHLTPLCEAKVSTDSSVKPKEPAGVDEETEEEVNRIMSMTDEEVWAETVRELGSEEAAHKEVERLRGLVDKAIERAGLRTPQQQVGGWKISADDIELEPEYADAFEHRSGPTTREKVEWVLERYGDGAGWEVFMNLTALYDDLNKAPEEVGEDEAVEALVQHFAGEVRRDYPNASIVPSNEHHRLRVIPIVQALRAAGFRVVRG